MSKIKGLIIKDLLQLKSYKRTLIVFIVIFIGLSITQEHTRNVLAVMMTLGLGMFSIATFSYDEMAKADKYILTLPLTKKEVVLAKYVLVIASTVIGAILGVIASIVLSLAMRNRRNEYKRIDGISDWQYIWNWDCRGHSGTFYL